MTKAAIIHAVRAVAAFLLACAMGGAPLMLIGIGMDGMGKLKTSDYVELLALFGFWWLITGAIAGAIGSKRLWQGIATTLAFLVGGLADGGMWCLGFSGYFNWQNHSWRMFAAAIPLICGGLALMVSVVATAQEE
jgi:hypothetical protein